MVFVLELEKHPIALQAVTDISNSASLVVGCALHQFICFQSFKCEYSAELQNLQTTKEGLAKKTAH